MGTFRLPVVVSPRMRAAGAGALLLLAGACNSVNLGTSDGDAAGDGVVPVVAGIALPQGYSVDRGRSLVLGEGENWTGRLAYTINSKPDDMVTFFRRQMPGFGWEEVSVVHAEQSVLTFVSPRTQRATTITIEGRTLWGSRVDMVVSPSRGGTGGGMGRGSGLEPAAPIASPRMPVSSQPIR